jgi:hypothetical protein
MKTITIAIVVVVMIGLAVKYLGTETVTYVKEGVTMEVIKEVTPDWASDEEAVQAAKDVIRKKELQAELETLDMEIKAKQEQRKKVADELTTY